MSEGIVNETHFNSAFIRDRAARIKSNSPYSPDFLSGQVKFPTYITTFRSGPSFDRSDMASKSVSTGLPAERIVSALTGDTGHEFQLDKTELFQSNVKAIGLEPNFGYTPQVGKNSLWQTWCDYSTRPFAPDEFNFRTGDAELRNKGREFIRATNPLKPKADLLVSVAELLREGFPRVISHSILHPSLKKGRKLRLESIGSEYLNFVFGYKPIVSDIVKVYDTLQKIDNIVEQWIRDDKKSIRRQRKVMLPRKVISLDEDRVSAPFSQDMYFPARNSGEPFHHVGSSTNPTYGSYFSRRGQIIIEEEISFSAQFSYDLSKLRLLRAFGKEGPMTESNAALREYLGLHAVGLAPTDASWVTVWNLIPFSWLVDWFTNIGELFDNFRAEQSAQLQMGWAYISTHATRKVHYSTYIHGGGGDSMQIHQTVDARQKSIRRLKATPYGFDVSFEMLSANQTAILGALALANSKH